MDRLQNQILYFLLSLFWQFWFSFRQSLFGIFFWGETGIIHPKVFVKRKRITKCEFMTTWQQKQSTCRFLMPGNLVSPDWGKFFKFTSMPLCWGCCVPLGENCALAPNQSVDCRATILFTISLNSAKVWNRGFNWPVFGVGMHKKSPNAIILSTDMYIVLSISCKCVCRVKFNKTNILKIYVERWYFIILCLMMPLTSLAIHLL